MFIDGRVIRLCRRVLSFSFFHGLFLVTVRLFEFSGLDLGGIRPGYELG